MVLRQRLHCYYNLEYFILCSSLTLEHNHELLSVSMTSRLQISSLTFVYTLSSILPDSYASNTVYLQSMLVHWNLLVALYTESSTVQKPWKSLYFILHWGLNILMNFFQWPIVDFKTSSYVLILCICLVFISSWFLCRRSIIHMSCSSVELSCLLFIQLRNLTNTKVWLFLNVKKISNKGCF